MGQPKITFYVDIVSPFGYLAYWMLRNSPTFTSVRLTLIPILLGGLHKQCNNTAPVRIKNKVTWINRERGRWAEAFGIPVRKDPPPGFPISTVTAQRALTALHMELGGDEEEFKMVVDRLWAAVWCPDSDVLQGVHGGGADGECDVKDPAVLKRLIASVVGEDVAARVVARVGEKDVKDGLVANTNRAFEAGAFGIPWFECENAHGEKDGFWGFDHFGMLVRFLGVDGEVEAGRSGKPLRALL